MNPSAGQRQWRHVHLVGALSADIRLETFRGAEHVVAPVVMLVGDAVIHPVNAPTPELVPANVLQVAPETWNGVPCVAGDHPSQDGAMISANSPSVLEQYAFGQVFGAVFRKNRLAGEAWLDVKRAAEVEHGEEIVARVRAREAVEISVGAYVVREVGDGMTPDGQAYGAAWLAAYSDHLALLREGLAGACSNTMGCGTSRSAIRHLVSADGLHALAATTCEACYGSGLTPETAMGDPAGQQPCGICHGSGHRGAAAHTVIFRDGSWCVLSADGVRVISRHSSRASAMEWKRHRRMLSGAQEGIVSDTPTRTWKDKLVGLFTGEPRAAQTEDMSDQELRELLGEALKRTEPQFAFIETVKPAESVVVYTTDPDPGGPSPLRLHQRAYTVEENGRVMFADDRVPVRRRTEYVPVVMKQKQEPIVEAAAADCGCQNTHTPSAETGAGGHAMAGATHRNAERIAALVASDKTPYTADDQGYLEGLTDERLAAFEAQAKPTAPAPAPAPQIVVQAAEQPRQKTEKEWLAEAPPELRQLVARQQSADAARHTQLVGALAKAQTKHSEAALMAMSLEQLEVFAEMAASVMPDVDYSVGAPRAQPPASEPPQPYTLALAKRKGAAA